MCTSLVSEPGLARGGGRALGLPGGVSGCQPAMGSQPSSPSCPRSVGGRVGAGRSTPHLRCHDKCIDSAGCSYTIPRKHTRATAHPPNETKNAVACNNLVSFTWMNLSTTFDILWLS